MTKTPIKSRCLLGVVAFVVLVGALLVVADAPRAPVAHAVVGDACPTGQNAECGDPLQVCRGNKCVSLENEPLGQIPVPEPGGGVARPGPGIANFVRYLYLFGVSFIGVVSMVSIFYGGLKYFLSVAGGAKENAKDILTGAALGLLLALSAYLVLRTINPALVSFEPIEGDLLQLTPPSASNPFITEKDQPCTPSLSDSCARELSCQGVRNKETGAIDSYRCLDTNLPPIPRTQECAQRPNACEPGYECIGNDPNNWFSATCQLMRKHGAGGPW